MTAGTVARPEQRLLSVRARPDLSLTRQIYHGQPWTLVKDPIALKYFRFREEAGAVLEILDGKVSLSDIKTQLESRFPDAEFEYGDLRALVESLYRSGLLLADVPGQTVDLLKRRRDQQRKRRLQRLTSILFLRLPGVDPERLLTWLYPKVGWLFRRPGVAATMLLTGAAGLLVTMNFAEFQARLPGFYDFFGAGNLVWMMLALSAAKILHELGHGLSCKHFGGECHEIGLMFLVFTPCLYCDTSDSWVLPNKWHRAAIGAAGMYIEILLASICTFVWWNTQPGMLHYLCLNTMFVCSVSAIVFNINPLLRYDGYYILADILEVPNLGPKSRAALVGLLRHWCLGLPPAADHVLPERNRVLFAGYAVASFCYRWFVMIAIVWFLAHVFEPLGLQPIGHVLIAMSLIGLIVVPSWKVMRFFQDPGRLQQVQKTRLVSTLLISTAVVLAVAYVPLPHRVVAPFVVQPRDAQQVYVEAPGVLVEQLVRGGDRVDSGDELAQLRNPEIRFQIARLNGEHQRMEQNLRSLERQQGTDPDAAAMIPHTRAAKEALAQRLRELQRVEQRLTLVANTAGVVIPPSEATPRATTAVGDWSGTALDQENVGSWLENGTLFCQIGDPLTMEAVLVIDQSDIDFVVPQQSVEVHFDEYPGRIWTGRIEEISRSDLRVAPRELSQAAGSELSTSADGSGIERLAETSWQARVFLQNDDEMLMPGFRGRAKINIGSRSLGSALRRFLARTFRL